MNRIFSLIILFLSIQNFVFGQDTLSTVNLEEIRITGTPYQKYAAGSKIQRIDSALFASQISGSLAGLLQAATPVYIKEYGSGMLSSISFRGTGASHTAVLWHGININSVTVGQSDFANIPLFLFNEVALQYGSASSLYGSDAIGGTVHLGTKESDFDYFKLDVKQEFGSFGRFFTGIGGSYRRNKFSGTTKIYRYQSENDFPFQNTAKPGSTVEKQTNAAFVNLGALQNLNYSWNNRQNLELEAWYQSSRRELQPSMVNLKNTDQQKDENFRLVVAYNKTLKSGNIRAKAAYLYDYFLYNQSFITTSQSLIASLRYEHDFSEKLSLNTGADWRRVLGKSDNYATNNAENRNDIFLSLRYNPFPVWSLNLNARQAFVTGFNAPFAPSIGSEWQLLKTDHQQLILKNLLGRSYRIPTLNDRFWTPGGNTELLPEEGYNLESGFSYTYQDKNVEVNSEAGIYQQWIDNWIIWVPMGSYWRPENVRKVHAHGIEWSGKISSKQKKFNWMIGGNYSYTRSVNQKGLNEYDQSVGKQLPYTPLHTASAYGRASYKAWNWINQVSYTGYRYTLADNSDFLEGYALVNTSIGYQPTLGEGKILVSVGIRNIFNKAFQNVNNYAMPGRNYQLSLTYNLTK